MAQVPEDVLDHYDDIPEECFLAGVPFAIRYHPDNVIIPFGMTLPGPSGRQGKWVKFSRFEEFLQSCCAYWFSASDHPSLDPLYLCIMSYTPLKDAHDLHLRIMDPYKLQHNPNHAFCADGEGGFQSDESNGGIIPATKQGLVHITDGVDLTFQVVNYTVLWSKTDKYCFLQQLTNPFRQLQHHMEICTEILYEKEAPGIMEALDMEAENARRILVTKLIKEYYRGTLGVNPHDAIQCVYPQLHDDVYKEDCQHCKGQDWNEEDSPSTLEGLSGALTDLGCKDYYLDLTLEEIHFRLMKAEGIAEQQHRIMNSLRDISQARAQIESVVNPILEYVRTAASRHTLVGAVVDVTGKPKAQDH